MGPPANRKKIILRIEKETSAGHSFTIVFAFYSPVCNNPLRQTRHRAARTRSYAKSGTVTELGVGVPPRGLRMNSGKRLSVSFVHHRSTCAHRARERGVLVTKQFELEELWVREGSTHGARCDLRPVPM